MIPRRYFSPGSRARGINLAVYLKAQLQRAEQECPMVALMSRLYQATGRDSLFSFRQASSNLTGVYDVTDTSLIPNVNMSRMKPNQHELITPPTALGMCTKTVKREGETHKTRDIDESDYSDSSEDNTSGSMFVESGQEGLNVNLTSVCSDTERRCEDRTGLTYGLLSKERKYDLEPHLNVYGSEAAVRPKVNLTEDRSCNNQADLERVTESGISLKSIPGSEPVIRPPKIHISEVQTDSFDMEEVQSHDGENAEKGTSRPLFPLKLLVRGASQQSDSSGFTEDYPLEKSIHAKVQSDKDTDNHLATKGTSSHLLPVKVLIRGASQQSDSSGFTEDYQIDTCIHPKVQSKESENHMGMKGTPKHLLPLKALVRGASQQSDSSGFTDDYPVEKSIHHKVQDSNNQFIRENRLTTPGPKCPTCFTVTQGPALGFNSESSSPYDSCSESDSSSGQPSRVMGSAVMLPQVPVSKDCKLLPTGLETQARQDLGKNIAPDEVPEGRRRPPLNKSHSLPTSLPSSHRVVSSLNVQLFPGNSICPSPCVSYHYSSVRKEDGAEDEKWQCSVQSSLIINKPNSQKRDLPPLPPKPQPSHLTSLPHIMPSSTLVWPVQSHWEQQSTWKAPSLPNTPSNNITYYTPSDNILNNTHMPGYHLTPQQQQQPPHYQKKWQELQKQLQLHKQWETPQLQQQCWQQPQPQLQPYLHPQSAPYAVSDHPPSSAHHQWPISRTANVPHGWVHNELHPEFYTHPDSRLYTNIHSRPQRLPAPLPSCFPHCATCANCSSSYPNSVKPSPGYLRTDRELQLRALHDPSGTAAHDIATVNPSKILSGSAIKKSGPRKFGGLTSRRNYTHKKKVLNEL